MKYDNIKKAVFIDRPNRFIANVKIDGQPCVCHVKNTGRCRELLTPGAEVYVHHTPSKTRKTDYDLVTVKKGHRLINMDSQTANTLFREYVESGRFLPGITTLKPECYHGNSRFDFYYETEKSRGFVEVKGVTLEHDGVASFPDAPTARGVRHLNGLINCIKNRFCAHIVFIIQMEDVKHFEPNDVIHKEFAETLKKAAAAGVKVTALCCRVTEDEVSVLHEVEVKL